MSGSDNQGPRVVLASRKNAGIRVTLLWAADANSVARPRARIDSTKEQFALVRRVRCQTQTTSYERPIRGHLLALAGPSTTGPQTLRQAEYRGASG